MGSDFDARKAIGALAEVLLRDLLVDTGAIVTLHQQNFDATRDRSRAAVAYADDFRELHIPDLEAWWPNRGRDWRCFIEAKAKTPLNLGGWGWDVHAFNRALRWMEESNAPTYYAIRNTTDVPLLPNRRPAELRDDPDLWSIASVWKLARSENRGLMRGLKKGEFFFTWPASDFMPLRVLLNGDFALQLVPYLPQDLVGDPPLRVPCLL